MGLKLEYMEGQIRRDYLNAIYEADNGKIEKLLELSRK